MGIALSEVAALGVAAGLFLGIRPEASAAALAVGVSLLLWISGRRPALPQQAVLGLVYCLAAAVAIIILAVNPMAEAHGVDLISGNLLYTAGSDLLLLAVLAGATFALHLLLLRNFLFVSFDPETARPLGIDDRRYEFLMYLTLGLGIAVSMKTTGILYVFSTMVIPPHDRAASEPPDPGRLHRGLPRDPRGRCGRPGHLLFLGPAHGADYRVQGVLFFVALLVRPR